MKQIKLELEDANINVNYVLLKQIALNAFPEIFITQHYRHALHATMIVGHVMSLEIVHLVTLQILEFLMGQDVSLNLGIMKINGQELENAQKTVFNAQIQEHVSAVIRVFNLIIMTNVSVVLTVKHVDPKNTVIVVM